MVRTDSSDSSDSSNSNERATRTSVRSPVPMKHLHLLITGRVQGVSFRASLADIADQHRVTGWVRNRRDGSVEAQIHGSAAACEAVLAWARIGPRAARVDAVRLTDLPVETPAPTRFELRPTV